MKVYGRPYFPQKLTLPVALAAFLSVLAFLLGNLGVVRDAPPYGKAMAAAAGEMERATAVVSAHCQAMPGWPDISIDPNRTGLIGPELGELSTSLGQLAAKRTTTNPDLAALLVHLLWRAGVREGSAVAIGSSGSFPALLVASVAATQALRARPLVILSLGASHFGATSPDFNLLRLYQLLFKAGLFKTPPLAVSLGGEKDAALDLEPALKARLIRQIEEEGVPLLEQQGLRQNVLERMNLYQAAAGAASLAVFVNIGGSYSNLGTSSMILDVKPGLHKSLRFPGEDKRGVLFEMAARGVPVIHLLFIRGLAARHGLPWDPVPLPKAGTWTPPASEAYAGLRFWMVLAVYVVALGLLLGGRPNAIH